MAPQMKTTFNIDDKIMKRLKEESVRQGRTMSDLLEAALRAMFRLRKSRKDLPPLPTFEGGIPRVNVANREALEDFLEGR
jgi:Ribbon-helix-helix protein, copG family